ncbi:hypothetical protein BCR42DRAFT_432362 [Absidia repens]|uniref:Uncharacterized protein n=1 Tax=Absidia repens TaxID=90262 RepID=A0A1X2IYS8_9FUNG|nr:hypothetical protein BCR42DRAFT_432362 [Absidia repens]
MHFNPCGGLCGILGLNPSSHANLLMEAFVTDSYGHLFALDHTYHHHHASPSGSSNTMPAQLGYYQPSGSPYPRPLFMRTPGNSRTPTQHRQQPTPPDHNCTGVIPLNARRRVVVSG